MSFADICDSVSETLFRPNMEYDRKSLKMKKWLFLLYSLSSGDIGKYRHYEIL